MKHIIVIDDTGSPGNKNESRFVRQDRKTLVAVFIHKDDRQKLEETISALVGILNIPFGITEIHLTDLINRVKEYSKLKIEDVLEIVEQLSVLLSNLDLPFLVQTCHERTFEENGIIIKGKPVVENFDFTNTEDQALFMLLIKTKKFMTEQYPNEYVEIVMDEGRKKNLAIEKFKMLEGIAVDSQITYLSSHQFTLLQIADIFAYSVNRSQMTLIKENRTEFDKAIIGLLSDIITNQYSLGISNIEVDLDEFTKDDYDYEQLAKRQIDGNIEHWKKAQNK